MKFESIIIQRGGGQTFDIISTNKIFSTDYDGLVSKEGNVQLALVEIMLKENENIRKTERKNREKKS